MFSSALNPRRHALWRLSVALALGVFHASGSSAVEPLTTVAQVRDLSPEEADRALPVRIRGVITYHDPGWEMTFLHDGKHGIYLRLTRDSPLFGQLLPGDEVEVTGTTFRGEFLPIINTPGNQSAQVRRLGHTALWEPALVSGSAFTDPEQDCEWVRLRGVIRAVLREPNRVMLEMDVEGRRFNLALPKRFSPADVSAELVGVPVVATGVVGTRFNAHRQLTDRLLHLPSLEFLRREAGTPPLGDVFTLPLQPMNALLRIPSGGTGERIHVRGVVTAVVPERGLFLRGEGGGLWVQTVRPPAAKVGDLLEAVGLPEIAAFKPELRAAVTRIVGHQPAPAPHLSAAAEALEGQYHADLITVEGTLTASEINQGELRLFLATGRTLFEVQVPATGFTAPPAQSRLRATGICLVILGPEYRGRQSGRTFTLQSRDAADLTVLSMPPWWTTRRALWALESLGALAALAAVWAFLLRRQVLAQTATIRGQLERETIHEERQRIARDWHDTMEQQLMGVNLLLADASAQLPGAGTPAAATESLGLARRMLGYCREESRASIRDLRSRTLEARGLPAALEEFLRPLAQAAGAEFSLAVTGPVRRLPARQEQHLLRLAQEAVANAAHHARARQIGVQLEYGRAEVRLDVRDDGCGFDPATPAHSASDGHFGLQGMAERAEKIRGTCVIESRPGAGARVLITAPCPPPP